MITRTLLAMVALLVALDVFINHLLPKEKTVVDTMKLREKLPFYAETKRDWGGYVTEVNYSYEFAGEEKDKSGEPYYIYNKYRTNYKWNNINWIKTNQVNNALIKITAAITLFFMVAYGVMAIQHNQVKNALEHQTQYVQQLNEEVDVIVKSFMEHEEITFDRDTSLEALIVTYPELRSVELVTNQLNTLKTEKEKLNEMELKLIRFKTTQKFFGLARNGE